MAMTVLLHLFVLSKQLQGCQVSKASKLLFLFVPLHARYDWAIKDTADEVKVMHKPNM